MDTRRIRRLRLLRAAWALAAAFAAPAHGGEAALRVLVHTAPLAGFAYHAAPRLWPDLRVGEALRLVREPDNPHDARAVAVFRGPDKLGYLPRAENAELAAAMDQAAALEGRIAALSESRDPWQRIRIDVFVRVR